MTTVSLTSQPQHNYACKECQRRRRKCSRDIPICEACFKGKRHCLYESQHKSRLTRKYLTSIEQENQLMKEVLLKFHPKVNIKQLMKHVRNGDSLNDIPYIDAPTPPSQASLLSRDLHEITGSDVSPEIGDFQIPQYVSPTVTYTYNTGETSLDTSMPPHTTKFNWDERKCADVIHSPTIVEGMAMSNSSGYLGATSSAAFLNLVGGGYFMHGKDDGNTSGKTWSEHSSVSENLNRLSLEVYMRKYYETYHPFYPIVYWPYFMACFNGVVQPPPGWESLLNIVAAVGSFLGATDPDDAADLIFFERAKGYLTIDSLGTGNLILVQTLTLMSNYLQKRDRPNTGYNYLGLAARMAMGLGIHKHSENHDDLPLEQECRRRIWWCLFVFDCGQTCTFGRPLGIDCSGIDSRLPKNFNEVELDAFTKVIPEEVDVITTYSNLRLQSLFHLLTNSIYERLISAIPPSAQSLLHWDKLYVERWKSMTPPYYREETNVPSRYKLAHAVMHWRCKNLRILMYRTFVFKFGSGDQYEQQATRICLEECHLTIESMDRLWKELSDPNRMCAWYSLFFLIPAVVMPLVCLRNDPTCDDAKSWESDILLAVEIIKKLKVICPPANRVLDLIKNVGGENLSIGLIELHSNMDLSVLATDVSPADQLMQLHSMLWPGFFDSEQT